MEYYKTDLDDSTIEKNQEKANDNSVQLAVICLSFIWLLTLILSVAVK